MPRGIANFSDLMLYADIFLWTTDAILRVDKSLFSRGRVGGMGGVINLQPPSPYSVGNAFCFYFFSPMISCMKLRSFLQPL